MISNSLKHPIKSVKDHLSGRNKYLDKLLSDKYFRLISGSAFGGGWNFIYAFYHLVLAAVYRSYWFLTMGVYYLVVCGMRASALRLTAKDKNGASEKAAIVRNGIFTFMLAIIFSGIVCLTIVKKRNTIYPTIIAISFAAFTFFCVVKAIVNLVKLRKNPSVQNILLRNTSLVYAIGSLFGLECMLLGTFGGARNDSFNLMMEALSGAGFFIVIVLFGIGIFMLASKRVKK